MKINYILFASLFIVTSCGGGEEKEPQEQHTTTDQNTPAQKEVADTTVEKSETGETEESALEECSVNFSAYINDPSGTPTNVRKTPGGDVVTQLTNAVDHELHLIAKEGSWYQFDKVEPYDYDSDGNPITYDIPDGKAWIHNSVLEIGTRNYGNQEMKIFAEPSEDAEVLNTVTVELYGNPVDVCGEFVKINAKNGDRVIEGWIKKDWVCANPVTNCS